MSSRLLRTVSLLVAACLAACTTTAGVGKKPISITEVVSEIEKALQEVKDKAPPSLPQFNSAEVALETSTTEESGGTLKLIVVTIGSKTTSARTQTISFKLTPPPGISKSSVDGRESVSLQLAKAIVGASTELKDALQHSKALKLQDLSATIKFEVSRTRGGEVGIDVLGATVGASREKAAGVSHSITLNYSAP